MTEKERLDFVKERDGLEGMLVFAEQTLAVYITDSIQRGPHLESIKVCIDVLHRNGRKTVLPKLTR